MPPIISIVDVHKSFGPTTVLQKLSFSVAQGETVVLIGRSGSGKSTILRCLNLQETWDSGQILIEGKPLGVDIDPSGARSPKKWSGKRQAEARMRIGMVFQQFNLFPHLSVLKNVMIGPHRIRGWSAKRSEELAMTLLEQVGVADKGNAYPVHLSGGQQQRVAIARALAMEPSILLLDEITSALDPERVGEVLDVIADLKTRGMTMVFVTHEIQFARDVADQIYFLEAGRIVEYGPPDQVLDAPQTEQLRRFLARYSAGRGTDAKIRIGAR